MNIKEKSRIVLSKDESDFLKELLIENYSIVERIVNKTLGTTYRYLAEDAVSELYILMCEKVAILKAHPCPEKWLFVAAKLTAKHSMKKHNSDIQTLPIDQIPEPRGNADIFEDVVYEIWLENKVPEKLISQLSKREKEVYYKLYIENKKPKDIAKELKTTENNIRNIHKNLRDKIQYAVKYKNF